MREEILKQINVFRVFNDVTLKGEIVVYGSTYAAEFPFYELAQKYTFSNAIYNRSVKGIKLAEVEEGLADCVLETKPAKLFLSLGEHDLSDPKAIEVYRRILWRIREKIPETQTFVLPVLSGGKDVQHFNADLRLLSETLGVRYLDLYDTTADGKLLYNGIFKQLARFFRRGALTFGEAFN